MSSIHNNLPRLANTQEQPFSAFDSLSMIINSTEQYRGQIAQDEFKAQQRNLSAEQRHKAKELNIPIENIAAMDARDPFETMGITTLSGKVALVALTAVNMVSVIWEYVGKRANTHTLMLENLSFSKTHQNLISNSKEHIELAKQFAQKSVDYERELLSLKGLKGFSLLLTNLSAKALFTGVAAGTTVNAIARIMNRRKLNKAVATDEALNTVKQSSKMTQSVAQDHTVKA